MNQLPLVEILVNGRRVTVWPDGSYEGLPSGAIIRISLPEPIQYSQIVREAARQANEKHNAWQERWHTSR